MIESKRMVTLSIFSASFSAFSPQILSFFGNLKWLIKSLILISLLTILHPLATATITIQSITGVSNWVKEGDTPIIYGGFAGSEASGSCTDNGDGTCNNCLIGSQILACNEKRVMLNSQVQISISSDTVTNSGPVILTTSDGNTKIGSSGDTIGKDEVGTFKATWSTICAAVFSSGAGASCVTTTNPSPVTLKIGIDEDKNGQLSGSEGITLTLKVHLPIDADTIEYCSNTGATFTDGVCGFSVFPGDGKVYIEDLEPTSTFPSAGQIQFSKARFFFSTTGFTYGTSGPNPGSNFGYKDIAIETENDEYFLADKTIDGLSNGTYYFFRIAMLDQANNVSFVTSNTAVTDACGKSFDQLAGNEADDLACPFIARPDEVVGLLTEDVNCFIATAAYGSTLNHHLKTFREFRHKILLASEMGRRLVKSYYRFGPSAARWIQHHPWARPFTRLLLWPLWLFARLSLAWGWPLALGLAISALLSLIFGSYLFIQFVNQRRNTHARST